MTDLAGALPFLTFIKLVRTHLAIEAVYALAVVVRPTDAAVDQDATIPDVP